MQSLLVCWSWSFAVSCWKYRRKANVVPQAQGIACRALFRMEVPISYLWVWVHKRLLSRVCRLVAVTAKLRHVRRHCQKTVRERAVSVSRETSTLSSSPNSPGRRTSTPQGHRRYLTIHPKGCRQIPVLTSPKTLCGPSRETQKLRETRNAH